MLEKLKTLNPKIEFYDVSDKEFASICSYTLWYYVLKNNSLSKMFIIKFSEPLFACLFGALILNENIFKWQYLIAFLLISFGIVLGNKSDNKAAVK